MVHGRYTIVGKLADGGMAEIFLAMQRGAQGFEKPVVLKRVLSAFSADPQFRNMFLDEAHISMTLNHGNIVQVLDVGVAGERTFLVLELVEGWDLERIMERAQATGPDHPWPPSLALYVTTQVCRGLAYAHAKRAPDGRPLGIVHRDVSPNNVLISEQGEVKLADFGIAKAETKREQTLAGVIKGKIGFMSPEQALGRQLDARADLFSVGTVMYLMLTGRRPFDAGSELESMMRAQRAEYRPPEELNPYLSPDATAIVNRAMRQDPSARYQTADEMLVDVERVLRSQYHSAGQTELKLWLGELTRRDGAVPIGRALLPEDDSARPVFVDEGGDLSAGSSVELTDIDGSSSATEVAIPALTPGAFRTVGAGPAVHSVGETSDQALSTTRGASARSGSETPVSSPVSSPLSSVLPPVSSPETAPTSSIVPSPVVPVARPEPPAMGAAEVRATVTRRLPRRSRVGLGFVLGALCMLGAVLGIRWLAEWAGRERQGSIAWFPSATDSTAPAPARAVKEPGAGPAPIVATRTVDAATAPLPGTEAAATDAGTGDDAREKAIDGDTQVQPSGLATARAGEEEEDRLLGRVVPDAATVIGEDEAEVKPVGGTKIRGQASPNLRGQPPRDAGNAKPRAALAAHAPPPPSAHAQPVQIRITSSPLGAVVRTKKQVLGRTPLAIRFNPGNAYELTFVKSGYITNSRRLVVASGKPQSISVAMKKAPPSPHHNFFLRGR